MMKSMIAAGVALALLQTQAHAQFAIGPQASFGTESSLAIGGRVLYGLSSIRPGLHTIVTANAFVDPCADLQQDVTCSAFEFTGGVALPLPLSGLNTYAGAGLGYYSTSVEYDSGIGSGSVSASETGLNVFGGLRAGRLFGEARYTTAGAGELMLSAGILFGSGGRAGATATVRAPSDPTASQAEVSPPAASQEETPGPAAAKPNTPSAGTKPYSLEDVTAMVSNNVATARILDLARRTCVSFRMDDQTETKLRRVGADPDLLTGLRNVCFSSN